jgi:hypothetical protein
VEVAERGKQSSQSPLSLLGHTINYICKKFNAHVQGAKSNISSSESTCDPFYKSFIIVMTPVL